MPKALNSHYRPFTGEEYIESLRDGRTVYFHGERVRDVTTHPAFRNSVRSVARLYDALHDPALQKTLMCETDTGSGGLTHKFFRVPRSTDDLVEARDAIAGWQRLVYGWMGRSPDYKASFLGTLGAFPEFYADYHDNAINWYRRSQEEISYWNHAIVHPPVDRHLGADQAGEVCMHVESETDNGLIVSGAKVVATGSALTHYNFIAHFGSIPIQEPEYAIVCTTPMDCTGVKLICRNSYELQAAATGSPFDYPLSSRLDENDSILVFDKVLIPWENVFLYGDVKKANDFFPATGFIPRFTFHGLARLCVKLDFLAGVLSKALRTTGTRDFRGVRANLGEVIAIRNLMWGLSDAMAKTPDPWENGAVQPSMLYGMAYRAFTPMFYPRIKEITQQVVASGLIYVNSNANDFKSDEIRPYLDKYVRGSNGIEALDRMKVMKLLWDATASEFGGRHELYERNYAGNHEQVMYENTALADASGLTEMLEGFADQCMSEYDLDGWTTDDFVNPDDVSLVGNDWG
ncbi:MAG: Pyoverdin chromophore biosynthetic protein pvcC [Acidimicrobiia bacterium]|nr:Pyoverdin chromophore biosynthetic protein pvcC [Acidimicrobiia bacterium]